MSPRHTIRPLLLLLPILALLGGCIPYTVGATAQTVPAGERTQTASMFVIPDATELLGDSTPGNMRSVDYETRFGIDDASDVGVRFPSFSGAVVNYKRRIAGTSGPSKAATSVMVGGGLVNWGEHAHFEATLMTSARTMGHLTPYGGVRVMQVAPLSRSAVHDTPTAGGYVGVRIGSTNFGVSPEIGVFRDRSALGLREHGVIIVPAITLHGELISALGDMGRFMSRTRLGGGR